MAIKRQNDQFAPFLAIIYRSSVGVEATLMTSQKSPKHGLLQPERWDFPRCSPCFPPFFGSHPLFSPGSDPPHLLPGRWRWPSGLTREGFHVALDLVLKKHRMECSMGISGSYIGGTYHIFLAYCWAYVRGYPTKILPYMVQYLHFRILEFPLMKSSLNHIHLW